MSKSVRQFLAVFLVALILFSIIGTIGATSYYMIEKDKINQSFRYIEKDEDIVIEPTESVVSDKKMTVFGVYGTDAEGFRSDVIMIAFFNHETKDMDIISIPRDTFVSIPDEVFQVLEESNSSAIQETKINHIFAYSDKEARNENLSKTLELLFNIEIDYYATVSIKAFRDSVDLLGGVPFYVPRDMHYSDPVQDLYIDLKEGDQILNGAMAEQLVRFRKGYSNADIGRIEMQHTFMKAFIETALNDKNRLNLALIGTQVLSELDTNFANILDYLPFLGEFSADKVHMITIPGEGKMKNGVSYYVYDFEATNQIISDILTGKSDDDNVTSEGAITTDESITIEDNSDDNEKNADSQTVPKTISSIGHSIEVLNATTIKGIAGRTKTRLEALGFSVTSVGNANKNFNKTQIIVREEGLGSDLVKEFNEPSLSVDGSKLPDAVDIQILIGSDDGDQ